MNKQYAFEVKGGSLMNNVTGCLIREPAVLMMLDTGSPVKLGEYEGCKAYYDKLISRIPEEWAKNYELIKFNIAYPEFDFQPEGYNLTVDEVSTLFNYLQQFSIGPEGWQKLKELDLDGLKTKLAQVKTWLEY